MYGYDFKGFSAERGLSMGGGGSKTVEIFCPAHQWTNVIWMVQIGLFGLCYEVDIGDAEAVARRYGAGPVPYSEWRIRGRERFRAYPLVDVYLRVDITPNRDVRAIIRPC